MDHLARDAMMAKQSGMSYGKWKALQDPVPVKEYPIPEGWRKCEYCGKPFKKKKGQRFCEFYCREQAYRARVIEHKEERTRKCRERNGGK